MSDTLRRGNWLRFLPHWWTDDNHPRIQFCVICGRERIRRE